VLLWAHLMQSASYRRELPGGLVVASTRSEHAEQLGKLQDVCFPTLDPEQRFKAEHYHKHLELFPDGQFVVLDGEKVVGMTSTVRLDFDFEHPGHDFDDIIQGGWLTSHQPAGAWMYGADIGTHPEYRRRGIAKALYSARHDTVRRLGLKGQVTVGVLAGFAKHRGAMTIEQYFEQVREGKLNDPTVSAQVAVGFEIRGLMREYLHDPMCDNSGACLVLEASRNVKGE
jgi:GNAT superfamily N-acetyltransferase